MTAVDPTIVAKPVRPVSAKRANKTLTERPICLSFPARNPGARLVFVVCGTALVICSGLMWLVPIPVPEVPAVVMKLLSSLFFMFCGLALLLRNHDEAKPEVHFDARHRELRVMQRDNHGRPQILMQRSYDTLGTVYISGSEIELWNKDGTPFVTLPVQDPEMRRQLRGQFGALCA